MSSGSPGSAGAELDEAVLRALVDAAPDGILMADDDGRILFSNHQAEQLFGFGPGELLGRRVDELLPERFRQVHRVHRARYRAEPRLRAMGAGLMLFGCRADGTEFPVEISLSPLTTDAGLRVVAVVRDVRERVETERRLHQAEQHLRVVEDRERIARDLHDIVIQKLFAAGMAVQGVAARSTDPAHQTRLAEVVDELDDTIREIRSVIFGLQAAGRESGGVRAEVLRIVDEHRDALGFEPHIHFDGPVDTVDELIAEELLPTVREAVSNVARHADASSVTIDLACGELVTLRVTNNGRGRGAVASPGNGLRNLAERRAGRLGGTCVLHTRPSGGTVLEWQVPNVVSAPGAPGEGT